MGIMEERLTLTENRVSQLIAVQRNTTAVPPPPPAPSTSTGNVSV